MKKSLLVLALALAAGAVFAEMPEWLSFGGWGRASFAPVKLMSPKDGDLVKHTGVGVSWMDIPSIGFWTHADSDHVGLQLELNADGKDHLKFADNANVWVKPLGNDQLTIKLGQFKVDDLRGKIGDFDGFQAVTLGTGVGHGDEDSIFHRFESNNLNGVAITSRPVEPLFIGLRLSEIAGAEVGEDENLENAWKKAQVGLGYTIANIGLVRVQYVGGLNEATVTVLETLKTDKPRGSRAELAFALTMIENLTLDLGGKAFFPVTVNGDYTYNPGNVFSLGVNYSGALGIKGRIDTSFGGNFVNKDNKKQHVEAFVINAHLNPTYDLGFITLGLDTGLKFASTTQSVPTGGGDIAEDKESDTFQFGIGAFAKKAFSNGYIMVGLGLTLPESRGGKSDYPGATTTFCIPVTACYYF